MTGPRMLCFPSPLKLQQHNQRRFCLCNLYPQQLTDPQLFKCSHRFYSTTSPLFGTDRKSLKHYLQVTQSMISLPSTRNEVATQYSTFSTSKPSTVFPTLLLLLSSLLFSLMQTLVRLAVTHFNHPPLFVAFLRGVTQVFFSLIFLIPHSSTLTLHPLLLLRGLLGAISICSKYIALSMLPVVVATALFCTTPIFAILLARVFLSEQMNRIDCAALTLTTISALLVGSSQPTEDLKSFNISHLYGVLLALSGAVTTGSVLVTMRALGTRIHFILSVLALGIGAVVGSVVVASVQLGGVNSAVHTFLKIAFDADAKEWLVLIAVGCSAFLAALCVNRAAQLLPAGRTGLLRTVDIPVNFVVAFIMLGEVPTWGEVGGCVLIGVSCALLTLKSISG